MDRFIKVYKFLNHISADVSAGAVVCAWFFIRVFESTTGVHFAIGVSHLVVLGLTVWLIYTVDHLLDVKRIPHRAATTRHRFHQRYFNALLYTVIGLGLCNVVLTLTFEPPVIQAGVLLGGCIIVYLLVQRFLSFVKEFFGAVFYTAGVVLLPWSNACRHMDVHHYLLILHFMMTAWINLLLFSWFDRYHDEKDAHTSFVRKWGEGTTRMLIVVLFGVCVLLCLFQVNHALMRPAIVFLCMDVVLVGMLWKHTYFITADRFRLIGDAVFFLPLLYLLL